MKKILVSLAVAMLLLVIAAGIAYAATGVTIVLASDEQVAAFEAAAQPIFASLKKDPLNGELIAAIKAKIGYPEFEVAYDSGQGMTLDDVVALALDTND